MEDVKKRGAGLRPPALSAFRVWLWADSALFYQYLPCPGVLLKLSEQDSLRFHMLVYHPAARKGGVFMRVVVVKFPKALCGLMRKIFHMDQE